MWVSKFSSILVTLVFFAGAVMFSFPHSSIAVSEVYSQKVDNSYNLVNHKDDISKLLLVLEKKTGDKRLIEKAKGKLSTLSEGEIRLISSLCERISRDSHSAGADIAFLLITTLIVFS